jgi:PAS domain S-box-containing protein
VSDNDQGFTYNVGSRILIESRWERPKINKAVSNKKINILIVDDKLDKLLALEAVLSELGQNILKANSGKEALRLLLHEEFAVILLDVNMPIMDGFETASLIRQRRKTQHTPIIFITAVSIGENSMYKGYALGAVDYIFTPVVPEVLKAKVSVFIELYRKTEETKEQAEQLRAIQEREHRRTLERLEIETHRNRFFVLAIDMLAIAGFDGHFKQLNPTWEKVLGLSEDELKSRPLLDFIHPEDRESSQCRLKHVMSGGTSISFENRFCCSDGTFRWLEWTVASFVAEQLLYLFARDVTERKRVEQALQETNTELESFSYTVSHDLRAPLRAMQGFADALLQDYGEHLDETGRDYAQRIVIAARRMDALIQDLLVYSRLSRMELPLRPVSLKQVIEDAMTQLEPEIAAKHADVQIQNYLPFVCGHDGTLVQVLVNLISNAIKFVTPGVTPQVHVHGEKNGDTARLWVEDNGIGIAPEYHSRIFRVFERLHGIEDYPGTGIGLAIVRKGMERMGGRVGLESASNSGTRFWIELQAAEPIV